jgi:hypothetical protein
MRRGIASPRDLESCATVRQSLTALESGRAAEHYDLSRFEFADKHEIT